MLRGNLNNIGRPILWVMADVLFDSAGKLRTDREQWISKVTLVIEIVIILKPERVLLDHPYYVEYKTERSLKDAQRALKQDPRPLCIISENIDDLDNETLAFSDNILSRYNISMR